MREFLYFIKDSQGRFYFEKNGVVNVTATPTPLKYTPDKWLDIEIQRQRNLTYFGIDRSFTIPLDFVRDGSTICKYLYYNRGMEEKAYLCIAQLKLEMDNVNYRLYYSKMYQGEIDFSQFVHQGAKVTLNLMEGGAVQLLKTNQSVKYEIPMTESILVRYDGIRLQQNASWIISGIKNDNHIIGMDFISQESISSVGALSQSLFGVSNTLPDIWNADQYFLLTGSKDTDVTITWDFKCIPDAIVNHNETSLQLQLIILKSETEIVYEQTIQEFSGSGEFFGSELHFQGTKTVTVPANCRVILYMNILHNSNSIFVTYNADDSLFTADYKYTKETTFVKCVRPLWLFQQLCAKMGISVANSSLLKQYEHFTLTCGDAIRGLDNPVIKTSMSDFFQSVTSVLGAAMSAEQDGAALRLESKDYYVDYSNPIPLGNAKDFTVKTALDYLYTSIAVGYTEQTYNDVNGKQEYNNTSHFTTAITKSAAKELNLVSEYRGDCFGQEFTRINLDGKTTTDSDADNDVFWTVISKLKSTLTPIFTSYELDRSLNQYVTAGLLEPSTVFNLAITPKQNLLRNGRFIHSCFYKMDNTQLTFQTTDKNAELVISPYGKPRITEKASVILSDLGAPYFTPNLIDFDNTVPYDILELFKANPLRTFSVINEGVTYIILPTKDSVKMATDEAQSFEGLSAPMNDLTALISYNG